MVFDEEFGITGALDMVFKTGEDTFAIYGKFSCIRTSHYDRGN